MTEPEPDTTTRRLVACGFVAPAMAIGAFAAAAARTPGYDHVADTVSKLSAQGVSDRWLWTAGLGLYAALMGVFAAGLLRRFRPVGPGRMVAGAVAAHAVLMTGVAVFRDDLRSGGFFSTEGAVHDVLSGMAFSALVAAMIAAVSLARADRSMRSVGPVTLILGSLMTAVGIGFLFTPAEVQGVPQRVFVALAAVWITFLAVRSGGSFRAPAGDRG